MGVMNLRKAIAQFPYLSRGLCSIIVRNRRLLQVWSDYSPTVKTVLLAWCSVEVWTSLHCIGRGRRRYPKGISFLAGDSIATADGPLMAEMGME